MTRKRAINITANASMVPRVSPPPRGRMTATSIVLRQDGQTFVLARGPELTVVTMNKLDDAFWSSVAVAGDHLLLRGLNYLYNMAPLNRRSPSGCQGPGMPPRMLGFVCESKKALGRCIANGLVTLPPGHPDGNWLLTAVSILPHRITAASWTVNDDPTVLAGIAGVLRFDGWPRTLCLTLPVVLP